jgi:hypothetical protein
VLDTIGREFFVTECVDAARRPKRVIFRVRAAQFGFPCQLCDRYDVADARAESLGNRRAAAHIAYSQ